MSPFLSRTLFIKTIIKLKLNMDLRNIHNDFYASPAWRYAAESLRGLNCPWHWISKVSSKPQCPWR